MVSLRYFRILKIAWITSFEHPNKMKGIPWFIQWMPKKTLLFISNTFVSNSWLKLAKIKQRLSNTLRLNFWYLKIIRMFHPRYQPRIIGHILKNKLKNKFLCIHEILRLIIMKMKMKMKKRSPRYVINRPSSWHGHKYSKYKKCLSMMMLICIKQHLSNIWSSIHEKVKQHWGWVEKKTLLIKKSMYIHIFFHHDRSKCPGSSYQILIIVTSKNLSIIIHFFPLSIFSCI